MKIKIYEFFAARDPDGLYFFASVEAFVSTLISIFVWMYVHSSYIGLMFPVTVAICSAIGSKALTWKNKLSVMFFISFSAGLFQFGLSLFIENKMLILGFIFLYTLFVFSFKNIQLVAAVSLFPAIIILGDHDFTYTAAVNRFIYQGYAFIISFTVAVYFSIVSSNFMIRRSVNSFLYFLIKRFRFIIDHNQPLNGYSPESVKLQNIALSGMKQTVRKEYLLAKNRVAANSAKKILMALFSISRGLLMLKNLNMKEKNIMHKLDCIDKNLLLLQSSISQRKKFVPILPEYISKPIKNRGYRFEKNNYILDSIISDLRKMEGLFLR